MSNQTLIQVPLDVANTKRLRTFLVNLIEKLDIVLGYRGGDSYVSQSELTNQLQQTTTVLNGNTVTLASLTTTLNNLLEQVTTNTNNIAENTENLTLIQAETLITKLAYTAPTVSAAYVQSEVQGIADAVAAASDKIDELIDILELSKQVKT